MDVVCGVVLALVLWIAPAVVGLIMGQASLSRIRRLDARLAALERTATSAESEAPAAEVEPVAEVEPAPDEPIAPDVTLPTPSQWPTPERVVVWVAAGIGGLLAVIAVLLLLMVGVERGWLSPVVRVAGGMALGVGLWGGGVALRRAGHRWTSSAFSGAGVGTLFGVLYAAGGLYQLLPATVAGAAMVAVTGVATVRAVVDDDRFLAWLALIGGALTPLLVASGPDQPVRLFGYLALLSTGMVTAANRRRWPDLVLGAAVASAGMFLLWGWDQTGPLHAAALAGTALLSAPFALAAAQQDRWLAGAGRAGAVTLIALSVPWLKPPSGNFVDPVSGLTAALQGAQGLWAIAAATAWLPVPLVLAGRRRGQPLDGVAPAVVASLLVLVVGAAWGEGNYVASPLQLAVALGLPMLSIALAGAGHSKVSLPLLAVPIAVGLGLGATANILTETQLGLGLAALGAGSAVALWSTRHGAGVAGLLIGLAVALGSVDLDHFGWRWLAGSACVSLAATSHVPLLVRWRAGHRYAWAGAALAGLALFAPLYRSWLAAAGDEAVGLLPLLLGGNALLGVVMLTRRGALGSREVTTAVFTGAVLLGIVAAVPLHLQERWLTVAWALLAAALVSVSGRVRHPLLGAVAIVLLLIVGVRLVLNPAALAWGSAADGWPILNWTLYSWGVPLLCMLWVAHRLPRPDVPVFARFVGPIGFVASLVGFSLVNVEVSHAFQDAGPLELGGSGRLHEAVRSASWAGYGLVLLGLGLWRDLRWVRLVGFAFVLLATFKVFVFDLWGLSGLARVGSVACLAVSLLLAALLFERLVLRSSRDVGET